MSYFPRLPTGIFRAIGDELAIAQPCFPVKVAHGHVQELLQKNVDYVLDAQHGELRASARNDEIHAESHLCPWNQTLPFVLRAVPAARRAREKLLHPDRALPLRVQARGKGIGGICPQTAEDFPLCSDRAVAAAYAAQAKFNAALQEAGARGAGQLQRTNEPALVLVGRPTTSTTAASTATFRASCAPLYGVNVLPMDYLPVEHEDITAVNPNMYWNSGRRILAAAQITRRLPNLHLVYISNFKCGPDSYIKSFIDDAARQTLAGAAIRRPRQ